MNNIGGTGSPPLIEPELMVEGGQRNSDIHMLSFVVGESPFLLFPFPTVFRECLFDENGIF